LDKLGSLDRLSRPDFVCLSLKGKLRTGPAISQSFCFKQ
jgi:hypothetical protein